tara:strand:+ start:3194 stop:3640 length:447 start_codon:yes stop_codon:yes gene_type:complete
VINYTQRSKRSIKAIKNKVSGFTLIEVMITVAIVGILASVAYPSYVDFVTRSNRAEALQELTRFANLQEQYFIDHRAYSSSMEDLGIGSAKNYKLPSKNYRIVPSIPSAGTFRLRAKALGVQLTNDPDCKTIDITDTGKKTPAKCWEQ